MIKEDIDLLNKNYPASMEKVLDSLMGTLKDMKKTLKEEKIYEQA